MKLAKCVVKKLSTNKYVVSENSCLRNFVNFQEKHPGEIAFLNKVVGYLTLTENVLLKIWEIYEIFSRAFTKNTRE